MVRCLLIASPEVVYWTSSFVYHSSVSWGKSYFVTLFASVVSQMSVYSLLVDTENT